MSAERAIPATLVSAEEAERLAERFKPAWEIDDNASTPEILAGGQVGGPIGPQVPARRPTMRDAGAFAGVATLPASTAQSASPALDGTPPAPVPSGPPAAPQAHGPSDERSQSSPSGSSATPYDHASMPVTATSPSVEELRARDDYAIAAPPTELMHRRGTEPQLPAVVIAEPCVPPTTPRLQPTRPEFPAIRPDLVASLDDSSTSALSVTMRGGWRARRVIPIVLGIGAFCIVGWFIMRDADLRPGSVETTAVLSAAVPTTASAAALAAPAVAAAPSMPPVVPENSDNSPALAASGPDQEAQPGAPAAAAKAEGIGPASGSAPSPSVMMKPHEAAATRPSSAGTSTQKAAPMQHKPAQPSRPSGIVREVPF